VRPLAESEGAFSRRLRAARRWGKNIGVRFRDVPDVFPGTARNVRRNLVGLGEGRLVDAEEGAVEKNSNRGMAGSSATQREGTKR
jgi:hypothetical protein